MDAIKHLRESGKISEREQDVLNWVEEYNDHHEENGTAREIHAWLAGQKGNEEAQLNGPNYIKPRLTELKDKGYIEEGEKRECSVTGRKAYELKIAGKQETLVEEEDDYYIDEDGNRYIFDPTEDPEDDSGGKSEGRKELEKLAGVDEDEDHEEDDEEKQTLLMQDGEVVS
jgi:hypothetical protein